MRLTLPRRLIDSIRCQRGQVLILAVGVMALSLGAIMISVDVGWWLRDKRDAQNDADAIALAAVQELPDHAAAELRGEDWALANGIDPSTEMEMTLEDCPDGDIQGNFCFIDRNSDDDYDKVRVKVNRPSTSFIAGALGVGAPTLSPPAAAATTYVVGACVMPWGIVGENDDPGDPDGPFGLDPEAFHVFQNTDDFVEGSSGNFGAIAIYGQGGKTYTDAIKGDCTVKENENACANDPLVFVDEALLDCHSKPGKMGNPTAKALDERFEDVPAGGACDADTYQEAVIRVTNPHDNPLYSNCWTRAVPVAVINAFPPRGASADIDVYGIAHFYLAGWDGNSLCFPLPDGSERCGSVWGYLMNSPASTAEVAFTLEFIPFAPTGVALVE